MAENVYERIHSVLTWKRIIAFNMFLFLVLVVPISVRLAQQDTENRSSAAGNPTPSVVPPVSYPAQPPKIDRVSEFFGKKGDTIVIIGSNFGDYQWGSKVYVGNVESPSDGIVRWTNTILEVQIPESARTGKVWVVINGNQAQWEGSLLLTDVSRSAQIGLKKESDNLASLYLGNASGVVRGMVEIGHVGEPTTPTLLVPGSITSTSESTDALGKKLKIEFTLSSPLTSSTNSIIRIQHPGIGALEIVRAELYDVNGGLVTLYADPLNVKIQ
jgi:hypothetical protein